MKKLLQQKSLVSYALFISLLSQSIAPAFAFNPNLPVLDSNPLPVSPTTSSGVPSTVNVGQFAGASAVTGVGASGSGVPRVTVSNDSTVAISGVASVAAAQSGVWGVGLNAGSNLVGIVSAVQSTSPWVSLDGSTGIAGASAPSYASVLGGVDSSGNVQKIKSSPYAGENALVVDNVANGTAAASSPAQVGVIAGLDSASNVRPVLVSASGTVSTSNEGQNPTYAFGISDFSPAASATDITCITGSATKTIYISRVQFSADATAGSSIDVLIYKRTTANTGAASAVTGIAYDSLSVAPTATVNKYNANPSALGAGQLIRADELGVAADVNGYPNQPLIWDFGTRNTQFVVLRGTAESLCINMGGLAVPAGFAGYIDVEEFER